MGFYPRTPMVNRRGIRCGVPDCRRFNGRWHAKVGPKSSTEFLQGKQRSGSSGALFLFWRRFDLELLKAAVIPREHRL